MNRTTFLVACTVLLIPLAQGAVLTQTTANYAGGGVFAAGSQCGDAKSTCASANVPGANGVRVIIRESNGNGDVSPLLPGVTARSVAFTLTLITQSGAVVRSYSQCDQATYALPHPQNDPVVTVKVTLRDGSGFPIHSCGVRGMNAVNGSVSIQILDSVT